MSADFGIGTGSSVRSVGSVSAYSPRMAASWGQCRSTRIRRGTVSRGRCPVVLSRFCGSCVPCSSRRLVYFALYLRFSVTVAIVLRELQSVCYRGWDAVFHRRLCRWSGCAQSRLDSSASLAPRIQVMTHPTNGMKIVNASRRRYETRGAISACKARCNSTRSAARSSPVRYGIFPAARLLTAIEYRGGGRDLAARGALSPR